MTEQVPVPRLTTTGLAWKLLDTRAVGPVGERLERRLDFIDVREWSEPCGARAKLARCLRSAQQQLADDRGLLRAELERAELRVAEELLVLRHPAAESRLLEHELLAR